MVITTSDFAKRDPDKKYDEVQTDDEQVTEVEVNPGDLADEDD